MGQDREDVVTYYINLFPARADVYSAWTPDGWRPVRQRLTPGVVVAGLTRQGPSISGYMITPANESHSVAVDFDSPDGLTQAVTVGQAMWRAGCPAYVEPSARGAHLWAVVDQVLPAHTLRAALRQFLRLAGLPMYDPKIELRPGTDEIAPDGLGHALRLPLMPHPVSGKRGHLVYPQDGSLVGKTLAEVMLAMDYGPADAYLEVAADFVPDREHFRLPASYREPKRRDDSDSASDILRDLWNVANARPGHAVRCPAHDDKHPSLSILRDDQRAICKSPTCILNNNDRGRGTFELRKLAPAAA